MASNIGALVSAESNAPAFSSPSGFQTSVSEAEELAEAQGTSRKA